MHWQLLGRLWAYAILYAVSANALKLDRETKYQLKEGGSLQGKWQHIHNRTGDYWVWTPPKVKKLQLKPTTSVLRSTSPATPTYTIPKGYKLYQYQTPKPEPEPPQQQQQPKPQPQPQRYQLQYQPLRQDQQLVQQSQPQLANQPQAPNQPDNPYRNGNPYGQYYEQRLKCQTDNAHYLLSQFKVLASQMKILTYGLNKYIYDCRYYGPNLFEFISTASSTARQGLAMLDRLQYTISTTDFFCLMNGPWTVAAVQVFLEAENEYKSMVHSSQNARQMPMSSGLLGVFQRFSEEVGKLLGQVISIIGDRVDSMNPTPSTAGDENPFADFTDPAM